MWRRWEPPGLGRWVIAAAMLLSACSSSSAKPPLASDRPTPGAPVTGTPVSTQALPPLPPGWPATTVQLGMADSPGGAAALKERAAFGFRYQYLSAGVNTGEGWATWTPDGAFVTTYIQDSLSNGIVPVFTYYQMRQSLPGAKESEAKGNADNLQNTATMTAYFNDLKLFFQRAGAFPNTTVVLHVEPDLWGYIEQKSSRDDAATVPAKVAATGLSELSGLPDNAAGFAQAIKKLRDSYAPNVLIGYHMSGWGTGNDITYSDPGNSTIDALAARASRFYLSLGTRFDISFAEFSDRDAAFKQFQNGDDGASWFNAGDFARLARFLGDFSAGSRTRIVMWQIPLGNTKMRAMNNTWDHYQDNRVEWLLDDASRRNLRAYVNAGVIAFLFGRGADGATCACDAADDGTTNPPPMNGNTGTSISADDDGGFFQQKARAYYAAGAMPVAGGGATSTPAPPANSAPKNPTVDPIPGTPR
ncbi:MAG: hypothetical protein IVW36_05270 [Dehalococcoidia bacterium]|nr:hypothetical protein [Dehalococcoidia bacterium]